MSSNPASFPDDLAEYLAAGSLLLTVNNRLARDLRERYERYRLQGGDSVWQTPDILPLGAWLGRCHQDLLDLGLHGGQLLSPSQERVLWEQVIDASRFGQSDTALLRPAAAAASAADAYRLLHGWQLTQHPELTLSPEGEAFASWRDDFDRHCEHLGLLPMARLPALLAAAFANGQLAVPGTLWLAGFDDHPPGQRSLLDALAAAGCVVRELDDATSQAQPIRLSCTDPAEERALVARWALARLQADPAARVAIVCPDIQGQREPLRQVLTHTLLPESLPPGQAHQQLPFNFSLGLPLAEQPLVCDGLLLLTLTLGEIEHTELAQLLHSPFLGEGLAESGPRALFDADLRRRGFPRYGLFRLRQQARRVAPEAPPHCPALFQRLDRLAGAVDRLPARASASHWAAAFQELLALWGWPGERALSSHEYQQSQAFNGLLGELARLDRIAPPLNGRRALSRLQQLARDTLFQPEGSNAPLQVLGMLEAAGQRFDHLWLLGLDDNHWPAPPSPNPLLPSRLQRAHELPHSSAARELQFARQVMGRLLGAASEVVLSHASNTADGAQDPSPLIIPWPAQEPAILQLADPLPPPSAEPLETLDDWQAPPAPDNLPGGTPLLADQAACPFRAFARHRLGAQSLENVSHGPDPRLLGNMVHQVLETLWRQLGSQQALMGMPAAELEALAGEAVSAAVANTGRERPDLYTEHFSALERQRLVELVSDWLQRERQRAPFRVRQLEQRDQARIGPLTLRIRADRVDELSDGRVVVIDYKTGRTQRTGTWTEERPEEPQVPLYALQYGDRLAAAAIARVRIDKDGGFKGLAADDDLLPGIKAFPGTGMLSDWAALIPHWQRQLSALAEEVVAGRADPTPGPRTCDYCDLAALCRVALMDATERDEDSQGTGGGDD